MTESRLKTWTQEQWNLAAWAIWRSITKKYGNDSYPKEKVLEWYLDYYKWLKEFDSYGGSLSDLRNVARRKIKEFEEKNI